MNRDDLQKKLDGLRQVADQHGTMTGDTTEQQYEDLGDAIAQVEQFLKHAAHHTLKIKPEPFADLLSGAKTCEVRANHDRDFRAGDTVTLLELAPLGKPGYSGRQMTRTISHVQEGYGLPVGLCVLSYAPVDLELFGVWRVPSDAPLQGMFLPDSPDLEEHIAHVKTLGFECTRLYRRKL